MCARLCACHQAQPPAVQGDEEEAEGENGLMSSGGLLLSHPESALTNFSNRPPSAAHVAPQDFYPWRAHGGLGSAHGGALTATRMGDTDYDGLGSLAVRSGPSVLVPVPPSGRIPLPPTATLDISTTPVGLMSIFNGYGKTMLWKGIDSIKIMRPKIGQPAPGQQFARYLGNLSPGTLGRRRLDALAASESPYAPYAAHLLAAVAHIARRCPFISTGNLGLSVMLEGAAAASHFDKPDRPNTVRGLSVRLARGGAAAGAAASAAQTHDLRFTLHLAHEGHASLVNGAASAQIEHKAGAIFMRPAASGETTIPFVPTDAQWQASVTLQTFARGRAVRVRLYHQRVRSALSAAVLHDHNSDTFDPAAFQHAVVEFMRSPSALYPHGLTLAQTHEPFELPTSFRQEDDTGAKLVDCWAKGQSECVRAKTLASRMATADKFAELFGSLLDERAAANTIDQQLATALPAERRVWALTALQVEASLSQLDAFAARGGPLPPSAPTVTDAAVDELATQLTSGDGRLAAAERRLRAEAQLAQLSQSMQRHFNWDANDDMGYGTLGDGGAGAGGGAFSASASTPTISAAPPAAPPASGLFGGGDRGDDLFASTHPPLAAPHASAAAPPTAPPVSLRLGGIGGGGSLVASTYAASLPVATIAPRASSGGAGGPMRTHIPLAGPDRARPTLRFGAGQGAAARELNKIREASGGKARSTHAARTDDLDLSLEQVQAVEAAAYAAARLARRSFYDSDAQARRGARHAHPRPQRPPRLPTPSHSTRLSHTHAPAPLAPPAPTPCADHGEDALPHALAGAQKLHANPSTAPIPRGRNHGGSAAYIQQYKQERKAAITASLPTGTSQTELRATLDIERLKQECNGTQTGRVIYGQDMLRPICRAWRISPSGGAHELRVRVRDHYLRLERLAMASSSR